jgi:predicted metal-dependent hydrolase
MNKQELLKIDNYIIPIKYTVEHRNSVRVSIGRTAVNIRIPASLGTSERARNAIRMKDWVKTQFKKNEAHFAVFKKTDYYDGQQLVVGEETYTIRLSDQLPYEHHYGDIKNGVIHLRVQQMDQEANKEKAIRKIISKLVSENQYYKVASRISMLNDLHFKHKIYDIRIKHNQSNWGSCSTNRIIIISCRLLFAPPEVRDYVYIHELSHLVHMDHSPAFWAVVAGIMPDYKKHEKWLKENNAKCQF